MDDQQCHHVNGTCLEGCDVGYEGEMCVDGTVFQIIFHLSMAVYLQSNFNGSNTFRSMKLCSRQR